MMSHLGRLPPLHAIGRSQCVDLEEPPDLPEDDVDQFLEEYDSKAKVYMYTPEHPLVASTALEQHFRVLSPGGQMCRNIPETATAFTHSRHSVAFSSKYAELRHLLQTQARLQLIRDYVSRLNAATMFVKDIEMLVKEEYSMWYSVCHCTRSVPPVTKLECLGAICEDLRIHMNHWNSVKQLLYTDPWLRPQLPSLILQIHQVQTRLSQLRNAAIWWIDRLIQIGFRVLAHCDLERIEADALWCITRGLEDFNSIVTAIKTDLVFDCRTCFSFEKYNSYQNIGAVVKPVPFARVLNVLASERARYASASTHVFFTSCAGFLKIALGKKGGGSYNWSDEIGSNLHNSHTNDTSDYHTASGSRISLGTAMLQVGGICAPDLSEEPSPLMDFARREKTFAQKFLQIVCHSTSLLLKRMPAASSNHVAAVSTRKRSPLLGQTASKKCDENAAQAHGSHKVKLDVNPEPPPRNKRSKDRLVPDGPELSKKTGGTPSQSRKSVSWSDAAEVSVIQQLLHKYMDMLWQYFGGTLADQFLQPVWGGPDGVRGQLGSTLLCSDLVLEVIAHMMQHTCAKDIFPPGAASVLSAVAERIQVSHAWRAWDIAMCGALASAATDKCHPVLLADGEHSSNTARSLRDAFHPIHTALHTIQASLNLSTGENARNVCLALAVPTVQRLVTSCDVSLRWCSTRGLLYLESWTLGAFLLVTQSDFKVLGDEVRRGAANCQLLSSEVAPDKDPVADSVSSQLTNQTSDHVTGENYNRMQLIQLQRRVEELAAQLQTLSGNLVKQFSERCHYQSVEYFEEEMPVGKIWKKRQISEQQLEPSPYVENALDFLLEPIVAGASKLSTTSQLSVISMATTAMCEAWTDVILEQKIKFSVSGALQLEADFHLVQTWLETYIQSASVKQSVLALDIFKYLSAIIDILKRQPRGRASSRPPESRNKQDEKGSGSMSMSDLSAAKKKTLVGLQINVGEGKATRQRCDVSTSSSNQWLEASSNTAQEGVSTCSENTADKQPKENNHVAEQNGNPQGDMSDADNNYRMPNMEQWLALRVQGGARSWPKLPSCFNNMHS